MPYRANEQLEAPHLFYDLHTNRKFLGTNPTLDYEFMESQGRPGTFVKTPEGQLLLAVMAQAFRDLKDKKLRKNALDWIENRRNRGVYSFVWIAENVLGCDAKKLREAMLK